ncbi:hypothetical protein D3C86_1155080 [compost metagenome]
MQILHALPVQGVDLGDIDIQGLDHRGLFFGGGGDGLVDVVDLADALGHAAQAGAGEVGDGDAFFAVALAHGHSGDRFPRAHLQLFDHLLDLQRRGLGASGQAAHFVRHHRKSTTRFTRPRRFNRCVERQQVGLLGDALDHFEDLPDVHGLVVEHFDVGAGGTDLAGQFVHHLDRALHHLAPILGLLPCRRSLLRGIGGVMGDLLRGRAQLVDCRRHAVGAGGLIVEIAHRRV